MHASLNNTMGWSRVIEPVRDEYRDRDGIDAIYASIEPCADVRQERTGGKTEGYGLDLRTLYRCFGRASYSKQPTSSHIK
nr:hypothetical protein Q903MT_gene6275 [Picea sitchensis]